MTSAPDKVTRFAADLVDSAAAEGSRQSRSARQQLDHWVRVGRAVSNTSSAARARVESALAGQLPMQALSNEEGIVFNAEVSAAVEANLAAANYGRDLADAGISTVALDEHGTLVEFRPDGSVVPMSVGSARPNAH